MTTGFQSDAFEGDAFQSGPNFVNLAGSSAGRTSATSVLSRVIGLAGSSAGAASASASISIHLAGSSHGAASASASLSVNAALAGASAGRTTVTSTLTDSVLLAGSSSGHATASALVRRDVFLAGTTNGVATATGRIGRDVFLTGLSQGSAATASVITPVAYLHALSAGSTTVSGAISRSVALSGSSSGHSTGISSLDASGYRFLHAVAGGRARVSGVLSGGSTTSSVTVTAPYVTTTSVATSPAAVGTITVTVSDATVFHVGQTVIINNSEYNILSISGNVLTLDSPLTSNVLGGALVGGLVTTPINTGGYVVEHSSLMDLEAMAVRDPILLDMQNATPRYHRSQPRQRDIRLTVLFVNRAYQQRRADYYTFAASLDSLSGLVTLQWTGSDGHAREYYVSVLTVTPDAWFHRATAVLVAPNPFASQVA